MYTVSPLELADTMRAIWDEVTSQTGAPCARSSHAAAAVGSTVFVFGGELDPRVPIDSTLHSFDLSSRTWRVVQASGDVPAPRVGVTMAAVGPTLYVFGGRDAEHAELDEFHSFDTATGKWTLLSKGDLSPPARSYHAMAADAATVFVFGGCGSSGRLNDLWSFSPGTGKWTLCPAPPPGGALVPRGGPGLVAGSGSVFVLFGFCGHELADVHRYDVGAKTWHELMPSSSDALWPSPRSVLGAAEASPGSNHIVVFGGEVDPSDLGHEGAGRFSDELFLLDTEHGTWLKLEAEGKGPGGRGWFAAAATELGMLVYGGNSESNSRLQDMFLLLLK